MKELEHDKKELQIELKDIKEELIRTRNKTWKQEQRHENV